jgi:hypothetical protein
LCSESAARVVRAKPEIIHVVEESAIAGPMQKTLWMPQVRILHFFSALVTEASLRRHQPGHPVSALGA